MFKDIGILGPNQVEGIIAMGGYPCQPRQFGRR